MKKITIALAVFSFFIGKISAQSEFTCGQHIQRQRLIQENPSILQTEQMFEQYTRDFIAAKKAGKNSRSAPYPYIIPIVFHIIHNLGSENITDAQVLDQMRILNLDYSRSNPDTSAVNAAFKNMIADMKIEFRLAKKDPQGNPTTGIEHIYSVQTNAGTDWSKLNRWPREQYLNVWVVSRMRDGVAGYAYFPSSVAVEQANYAMDGIIILDDYIGSIGTANGTRSRALTHEVGHWLNLPHTWGFDNNPEVACGDDNVDDTPITQGHLSCSQKPGKICQTGVVENIQNFMEYSYCSMMFTTDQQGRTEAAITSPIAGRNNLWSEANQTLTGVDDPNPAPTVPIAMFGTLRHVACVGESVKFINASYNSDLIDYTWTFPADADIATSNVKDPTVTFSSPGWKTITLKAENANGSNSYTSTEAVYIQTGDALPEGPYFEAFNNPSVVNNWIGFNYDRNNSKWSYAANTGKGGNGCMKVELYKSIPGDVDEIITPVMDLTSTSTQTISFDYSLATMNTNYLTETSDAKRDSIVVYASKNCGLTWTPVLRRGGPTIVNAGILEGAPYTPGTTSEYWKTISFPLTSGFQTSGVQFKLWVKAADRTNNFYLDNWNVGGYTTGIENNTDLSQQVTLYPNPMQTSSTLFIADMSGKTVEVAVYTMDGKLVENLYDGVVTNNEFKIALNNTMFDASGIYFVRVKENGSVTQKKLTVIK